MNKVSKSVVAGFSLIAIVTLLSACQKKGPAEQAGESIDNATQKAGQQIEKAGEKIQDAAKSDKK